MSYTIDWSAIVAFLALTISFITYFKHEKKIKQQERLLNDYQLTKIEEEKDYKRKAQVKANFLRGRGGDNVIKIYNSGQCQAKNVQFILTPEEQEVYILNASIFPYEFLNPQESVELNLITHEGSPDKLKITLTWDDDFKLNNQYKQILTT